MTVETLVIGAGPSGLAVAACLTRRGVEHLVVDAAERVGSTWHTHYERLHLHTAKRFSHLPHYPMPADYPDYPARDQVAAYLAAYAEHFGITPRLGVRVEQAIRTATGWRIQTDAEGGHSVIEARNLIVATGYNAEPKVPDWPGKEVFAGEIVHSAHYGNGARFQDQDVLVVGIGNSGAEIAIDLWEYGARPAITVRSPIHIVPRDILGQPAQAATVMMRRLPARLVDRLTLPLTRRLVGDLSALGITRPDIGPLQQIERDGRVPLIDVGTVSLMRQGAIGVITSTIAESDARTVRFADGSARRFDAIVLATGYRASLQRFLEDADAVTDARGYPTAHGRESALRGLYFCGFKNPWTGALRESALEAERIASAIATRGVGRATAGTRA